MSFFGTLRAVAKVGEQRGFIARENSRTLFGNKMHELAYAQQILEFVEREARERDAIKVCRVKLKLGTYSGLDQESLSFCLEAISAETLMDGASIEMEDLESELVCDRCGRFPHPGGPTGLCPRCHGEARLSSGTGMYIQEIELDGQDDQT